MSQNALIPKWNFNFSLKYCCSRKIITILCLTQQCKTVILILAQITLYMILWNCRIICCFHIYSTFFMDLVLQPILGSNHCSIRFQSLFLSLLSNLRHYFLRDGLIFPQIPVQYHCHWCRYSEHKRFLWHLKESHMFLCARDYFIIKCHKTNTIKLLGFKVPRASFCLLQQTETWLPLWNRKTILKNASGLGKAIYLLDTRTYNIQVQHL